MQTLRTTTTQPSFTPNSPITLVHAFHVHHELIRLTACTSRTPTYGTPPSSSHADTHTPRTTESALDHTGATSQQGVKSGYHRIHAATSNNQMKESITMRNYSHGIDDTECILLNKPIAWIRYESKEESRNDNQHTQITAHMKWVALEITGKG